MAGRIAGRIQSVYAQYRNSRSMRDTVASELISDAGEQRLPQQIGDELRAGVQCR